MGSLSEKQPVDTKAAQPVAASHDGRGAALPDHEVTWDGPDDPENPYNWPSSRKISVAVVCSASQLVTTMSASMIAPALDQILEDVGMDASTGQIAFSVFFLGLGLAPFLVAALAEMYGRKPIWIIGNTWYILWNSLCPVGSSPVLMILGRFLCACGACVGITLTGPTLSDMYTTKDRGKSQAIAGLLPYLGVALGPIVGGLAAQKIWWPWLFWILSAFDALALGLGIVVIRESYAPVLLRRKGERLARLDAPEDRTTRPIRARFNTFYKDLASRIGPAMMRPIRLLTCRPVILIIAFGAAIDFGVYTLVLSTFASLWTKQYNQSETQSSLHYIALALGAFVCAQAGGRIMDYMWRRTKSARPDHEPTPEWRIPYMIVGLIPGVAGIFWYAWSAEKHIHWAVVDVGIFFFTCGNFMFTQGLQAYQVDEFTSTRAASAGAATRLGTYLLGFAFPIFAPELYDRLGYGWGNTLLGLLFSVSCGAVASVLFIWGKKIRLIGRTAEDEKERIVT